MHAKFFGFILHLVLTCFLNGDGIRGEPVCTSRFDYEFKVLSKLVELETEQKRLQETVGAQQSRINELQEKHGMLITELFYVCLFCSLYIVRQYFN